MENSEGPEEAPRKVARAPELKGSDRGHENVEDERGRFDLLGRKPRQRHDGDVTEAPA